MIVLSFLTLSQWICIKKGFWIYNIWKVTQYCVTLPRLRWKHRNKSKQSQNIHSFRGVFAPTGHIYKPLIEKSQGSLGFRFIFTDKMGKAVGDFVNS